MTAVWTSYKEATAAQCGVGSIYMHLKYPNRAWWASHSVWRPNRAPMVYYNRCGVHAAKAAKGCID